MQMQKYSTFEAFEMRHDVVFANTLSPAVGERKKKKWFILNEGATTTTTATKDGTGASFLHIFYSIFILISFSRTHIYKNKIFAIISKPPTIYIRLLLSAGIQAAVHSTASVAAVIFFFSWKTLTLWKCHSIFWINFSK